MDVCVDMKYYGSGEHREALPVCGRQDRKTMHYKKDL